jgi:adenine deaminase
MKVKKIEGLIVDPELETISPGRILFTDKIEEIKNLEKAPPVYIIPGFIDAHIHIESSMLIPSRFAKLVVPRGTVAVVSDPHEIANVLGIEGIKFMIKDAKSVPMKFYWTAPSCVPATVFETAGAIIGEKEIEELLSMKEIVALGEMMNFPGVINGDEKVMKKIEIAKKFGKPVDGHAPGLMGEDVKKYFGAGISTDHECVNLKEAIEKAEFGVKVMVREGSSAKNLEALWRVSERFEVFLVSDDIHPDDLLKGHLDLLLNKAISAGMNFFKALRAVTSNPSKHYSLPTGRLREGMSADFLLSKSIEKIEAEEVYIDGKIVARKGKALFKTLPVKPVNKFKVKKFKKEDFVLKDGGEEVSVRVISAKDGSLITEEVIEKLKVKDGIIKADPDKDVLKISVLDRYGMGRIANGFIKGFGLKNGAIGSSVAHDSHNIVVVGVDEDSIYSAVKEIVKMKGGLVAVKGKKVVKIPLKIAGLMSDEDGKKLSKMVDRLNSFVKEELGCTLKNPFGTLSFMALLVIPEIKMSDMGLFDGKNFRFTEVIYEKGRD